MKKVKDTYYGLDIQKEYIAVVQYSQQNNAVTLVALQPTTSDNLETVSRELGILKSKFKFLDSRVHCSLPVDYAVVRTIPVDRNCSNVESALEWEFEQNIIGTPEDYLFDYQQIATNNKATAFYQVIGYRKARVDALTALLKTHKLIPRSVDLDVFALVNLFEVSYRELTDQPAILIHAETADARIVLTQNGKLLDYECITYDPEPDPRTFFDHLSRTFPHLGPTPGSYGNPAQTPVFATGLLFTQNGFLENLKTQLPTISLLQPFTTIECRIGVDEEKLATFIAQLSIAIGLAIRGDE